MTNISCMIPELAETDSNRILGKVVKVEMIFDCCPQILSNIVYKSYDIRLDLTQI